MGEQITYTFQVDSDEVVNCFKDCHNYLIEYLHNVNRDYCVIYFSSNDIYYPNNVIAFNETIIKRNKFEWVNNKLPFAYKHIFLRDIKKQWYLDGINASINSPEKLLEFLRKETKDFKIITVGSSAGGYAAVLYGELIQAQRIYTFNGQFSLNVILPNVDEKTNPLLVRKRNNTEINKYYDLNNFITKDSTIFYFQSVLSVMDIEQYESLNNNNRDNVYRIKFLNSNHGFPFFRFNLKYVFSLTESELIELTHKEIKPINFSFKAVGIVKTFYSYIYLALNYSFKLTKRKLLRLVK